MSVSKATAASPRGSKPTSARCEAPRLRSSSPATTSSTAVSATCATTRPSRRAQRRPPTRAAGASPRRSPTRSGRDALSAGSRLASMPVTAAMASVKVSTRASSRRSSATSTGSGSSMASSARMSAHAHATEAAAPSTPSTRPSTSSCCDQPAAAGAHRQPHADLAAPRRGARQQHAGDVGAGDEQHQADDGHQAGRAHRQHAAGLWHEQPHVLARHRRDARVLVGLRVTRRRAAGRSSATLAWAWAAVTPSLQPALDEHPAIAAPLEPACGPVPARCW